MLNRLVRAAIVGGLVVGGGVVGTTSPASAASCYTGPWANLSADSGKLAKYYTSTKIYHGASAYSCTAVSTLHAGQEFFYHCQFWNSLAGEAWTRGRISGTNIQGWVRSSELNDGGAKEYCR